MKVMKVILFAILIASLLLSCDAKPFEPFGDSLCQSSIEMTATICINLKETLDDSKLVASVGCGEPKNQRRLTQMITVKKCSGIEIKNQSGVFGDCSLPETFIDSRTFKSRCVQTYLALNTSITDVNGVDIHYEGQILIPSGCECQLYRIEDLSVGSS